MLCGVCSNINVDELIPVPALLQAGVISGTAHHVSYEDLEKAAENGCILCKIIDSSPTRLGKNPSKTSRMRKFQVQLKMLLQGSQNPGYQGGTKLLVACGGDIIARFEAYVLRGRTDWLMSRSILTHYRISTGAV
jgi:hypothetical protein